MIYHGIVESILDPLKCGRVKVRIFGLHTDDKNLIPTDDLPWAQVLMPTDSASLSGVGLSGQYLVNGSWVVVDFLDQDQQYPLVLGTIHGIPKDPYSTEATDEQLTVFSGDKPASVVTDSSGNPVTTSDGTPVQTGEKQELVVPTDGARRASNFTSVSDRCIKILKESEGFSQKAYKDANGLYSIGYGSQYYKDGSAVKSSDTITQSAAVELMKMKINSEFLPSVHRNVKVPVTQGMVDALVDFSYNMGIGAFARSSVVSELNAGRYEVAAAKLLEYNKANKNGVKVELPALTTRRTKEKNLFLSDGVPTATGDLDKSNVPQDDQTTGAGNTSSGIGTNDKLKNVGFSDPSGKYPLYRNEPDTNRLSRHEKIANTIVYKKETARRTGIPAAGGSTFDQPEIPYNAQYPFNKVLATESGHVMEFDDTEHCRRVHLYHAAGTFIEIDDNGTQVNRIVGDGFEILERNGFVFVNGALNVTVNGATNLKVGSALNVDVDGATNINIFNNANLNIGGTANIAVKDSFNLHANKITLESDTEFNIKSNQLNLNGSSEVNLISSIINNNAGAVNGLMIDEFKAADDHSKVITASGSSGSDISGTGLSLGIPTESPEAQEFGELTIITRGAESSTMYETPDEGDPTAYNNGRIDRGEVTKEDLSTSSNSKKSEKVPPPTANTVLADCGAEIHNMTDFPPDYKISKYFNIGHLTKNNTRPIIAQMGLSKDQIACNLKMLAVNCMDTIKDMYPNMIITSGFRRPGDVPASSQNSRHYYGEAVDIQLPGTNREGVYNAIKKIAATIDYDQLILEYQGSSTVWIHVSYKKGGNRRQAFTMNNHSRCSNFGEFVLI